MPSYFNNSYKDIINSLIFSIILNVKVFSVILGIESIIPMILIGSLICTFIINDFSILARNITKLKIMLYYIIITTLLWTISPNKIADLYYFSAILFGVPAIIISNVNISFYWTTLITLIIGFILFATIDVSIWILESDSGEKMYYSYLVLPFVLFAIYGLFVYKRNIYIIILSILTLIIYIPILLAIGVRGVYISLILFFILMFINTSYFEKRKKFILIAVIIVFILLYSVNWLDQIENLSNYLQRYEMNIYLLEKYIIMLTNGDVSNGRFELYRNAFTGFLNSPIWGNGFGVFEKSNEGLYVHNIFLEILYEGGLLLSILFVLPFYRFINLIKNSRNIEVEYYLFVIILFILGCSILFFSNTLWRVVSFWIFFGFILNKFKYIKNE